MMPADPPGFSVIIPTYQRQAALQTVLAGLSAQVYPRPLVEVIVVCDGSTDGSAEMVRLGRYPFRVHVLEQTNRGPAAARNVGLAHARGPFVLFLDDDVVPAPLLLAQHAIAHGSEPNLAVIGPLLAPVGYRSCWVAWETATLEDSYAEMERGDWAPTPRQFFTGNASVRLEHLRRAGGFNEQFRRGEDVELGFRLHKLGLRFVFRRAAAASHIAERSYREWVRTAYEYGRTDIMLERVLSGRDVPPGWVPREFRRRHPYTQRLVRWGLRHRRLAACIPPTSRRAAALAVRLGRPQVAHDLCSAVFNLSYWWGVSDRLGGYARLRPLLDGPPPAAGSAMREGAR